MRLLERGDNGELRLTKHTDDAISQIPPYAILSHTWGHEEVPFKDLEDGTEDGTARKKAGYAKIQFCGDQAWRDGLKYFWVDTCCIDKSDASKLQHALEQGFRVVVCVVSLAIMHALAGRLQNRLIHLFLVQLLLFPSVVVE